MSMTWKTPLRRAGFTSFPARLAGMALLAATACATTEAGIPMKMSELPAQTAPEGERSKGVGELNIVASGRGGTAIYGPWRVAGPGMDMSYAGDNAWVGSLGGESGRVVVSDGKISGAAVKLHLLLEGQKVTLRGTLGNRKIWITVTPDSITGKTVSNGAGFELKREGPGLWVGNWGPGVRVTLTMKGEPEGYPKVLAPQFYLALLGVLL